MKSKLKLVVRPNIDVALTAWRNRADIPNTDGYKLLIRHVNGSEYLTTVMRGEDGLHRLANIAITDVVSWIPATATLNP